MKSQLTLCILLFVVFTCAEASNLRNSVANKNGKCFEKDGAGKFVKWQYCKKLKYNINQNNNVGAYGKRNIKPNQDCQKMTRPPIAYGCTPKGVKKKCTYTNAETPHWHKVKVPFYKGGAHTYQQYQMVYVYGKNGYASSYICNPSNVFLGSGTCTNHEGWQWVENSKQESDGGHKCIRPCTYFKKVGKWDAGYWCDIGDVPGDYKNGWDTCTPAVNTYLMPSEKKHTYKITFDATENERDANGKCKEYHTTASTPASTTINIDKSNHISA